VELDLKSSNKEDNYNGQERLISRITVAHAIYFLIIIVAAALRLLDLGFVPLSPTEATEALATWDFWQPDSSPVTFSSPIYFSTTVFLTQVLGFTDAVMRLVPALFGIGLVILPWILRHRIGILGALLAGLLFALSPSLTVVSRTAGGQSAAIFAGLLCLVAWLRYQETSDKFWFFTLAGALGLGLVSAPVFYSLVLIFGLAWFTHMVVGPALLSDEEGQPLATRWPGRQTVRDSALILVTVLIVGATAFLLLPGGIGAAADIIATWTGRILDFVSAQLWLSPFMAIGRYEITLIILGLPAIIWATRNGSSFPTYLVYAICWAFLLILFQPGEMSNLLVMTIPGYLLIGNFTGQIFGKIVKWYDIAVMLIVLLAGGIAVANVVRYGRLAAFQSSQAGIYHLLLALTAFVLATIAITIIWSWSEHSVTMGVTAGLLLLLFISMWSSAWWFSRDGRNDTRELWTEVASDGDVRLLAESIKEISWQITNSATDLNIKSTIDSPSLRWHLRDMVDLEIVSTFPNSEFSQALITPMTQVPPLTNDYIGMDFTFLRTETSHILEPQQILTWWLFRESPVPINEDRLILWLRADLAGGSL
jgi:hypothetical protein